MDLIEYDRYHVDALGQVVQRFVYHDDEHGEVERYEPTPEDEHHHAVVPER